MSHKATNWAMAQTGLRPAEKLLLLCLADRHNPDYGCFPDQATLARDACMSRASVNDNLARLEAAGLIRRERRLDGRTQRQKSTRYILGFEIEDAQEPCPETGHGVDGTEAEQDAEPCRVSGHGPCLNSGHGPCPDFAPSRVQNLDSNPVREPVIKNPPTPQRSAGVAAASASRGVRRRRERPEDATAAWLEARMRRVQEELADADARLH